MVKIYSADEEQEVIETDAGYAVPVEPIEHISIELDPPLSRFEYARQLATQNIKVIAGCIGFIFVVLIGWLIFFFFISTHTTEVHVQSFRWTRQIEVIQYLPRHRDGWNRPPSDAYDVDRDWRYHYSRQVLDHYETDRYSCGTTENPRTCTRQRAVYRSESVYDWYYHYTVNRWAHSRWIVSGGQNHLEPYWHDLSGEHFSSVDMIGNEQLSGKREETYTVVVSTKEGNFTKDVPLTTWRSINPNATYVGHITRSGNLRSVNWSQ